MARKPKAGSQPVEEDGEELLPVPGAAIKAAPKKKPGRKKTPKKSLPKDDDDFDDGTGDAVDSGEGANTGTLEMDGLPQHSRRTMELEEQMRARMTGAPIFPYPPELKQELKPYWLELVNSFPTDHFQTSDVTMMKMYCQCAYDIERISLKIEDEGEVVIGGRGQPIVNPRFKVLESNRATLLSLNTKFRNQPASRVNTENFSIRQQKAGQAANAAQTATDDEDGLLATPSLRH